MSKSETGNCEVCGKETAGSWTVDGHKYHFCGHCLELVRSYGIEPKESIAKAKRDVKKKKDALCALIAEDVKNTERWEKNKIGRDYSL